MNPEMDKKIDIATDKNQLYACLADLQPLLTSMAKMLGRHYEVILHDLSDPEHSIVFTKGIITNREIGGPTPQYVLALFRRYKNEAPDRVNYKNISADGKTMRSSSIFIRNKAGEVVGCLCFNQDITDYLAFSHLVDEQVAFAAEPEEEGRKIPLGEPAKGIGEMMEHMVSQELVFLKKPVSLMQKEDKLGFVLNLEEKGIFDVKGSVEYVADRLGVSSFTIYNYLKEVRTTRAVLSSN